MFTFPCIKKNKGEKLMKKILITGATGFICSRLAQKLSKRYEVVKAKSDILDIKNEKDVSSFFQTHKPDLVIHGAAVAQTKFCEENPEFVYDLNVNGSIHIAKASKEIGAKMVFFSSEQVFNGNAEQGPFSEEDEPNPNTQYGKTKLTAEKEIQKILDEVWILRLTWMFGMPERNMPISENIIWNTIESLMKKQKMKVPVNEYRGMTYVYDFVDQFEKVLDLPYGIYHMGSENKWGRHQVVEHILNCLAISQERIQELLIADEEKYPAKSRDVRLDTKKIQGHGFSFDPTPVAIEKCMIEHGLE
ncbi:MAG TPA: NAD(P)-dependent oxidoreductase [Eubacteriaceae bacterium]|nr:NAD(P)-dependent oxidoreductase [Eubacteriaceae bacterium]